MTAHDTPAAPGRSASPARMEALVVSSARIIRNGAARLELGADWDRVTAGVLLAQPVVRAAFAALEVVEGLRGRHVEVPWGGSTESTVCGCGAAWPCEDARLLGGAA